MRETKRDIEALAVRVERLEAQNRRWKLMNVVVALTGVSLVVIGAGRSDTPDSHVIRARTVEAQDFLVKDDNGRVRARLSLHPNGKEVKVGGKVFPMFPMNVMPGQAALLLSNKWEFNPPLSASPKLYSPKTSFTERSEDIVYTLNSTE
jgi:hypothetical protein